MDFKYIITQLWLTAKAFFYLLVFIIAINIIIQLFKLLWEFIVFLWNIKSYIDETKKRHIYQRSILNAHKAIGFPEISKEQQFYILDTGDTKAIDKLVDSTLNSRNIWSKYITINIWSKYITVTPGEYLQHLYSRDLKNTMKFDPKKLYDGYYIRETEKGFDYMCIDRMSPQVIKSFNDYEGLLRYLVYRSLRLYSPGRNSFIKTRRWSLKSK